MFRRDGWGANLKVKGLFYFYTFDLARSGAPKVSRYAHGKYFYTFDLVGIRVWGGLVEVHGTLGTDGCVCPPFLAPHFCTFVLLGLACHFCTFILLTLGQRGLTFTPCAPKVCTFIP